MGQSSHNTNLNLTTPTSFLSYKVTKSSGYQKQQPNTKLSTERNKIFNEILQNAKQQSSLISHRKKHNKKQLNKLDNYINPSKTQYDPNNLTDIENQIINLLTRNKNANDSKMEKDSNNIESRIAQQLKEMGGKLESIEENEKIEEHVYLNNIENNNNKS